MQWLVHGLVNGKAMEKHEHKVHTPGEAGLAAEAAPGEIVKAAQAKQWDLVTVDGAVALHVFESGEKFSRSIVYLREAADEHQQEAAIDRLFERYKRLTPGRLYTVTANRVKIRQLPGGAAGL